MRVGKVYKDINESDLEFTFEEIKFIFSSEFYLNKFKNEYREFLRDETMKLKLKFKTQIEADYLILNLLYKRIEKRGYRVYYKGIKLNETTLFSLDII